MEINSIDLTTSKIAAVQIDGDTIQVIFEPAYIVRTMTDAIEKSLWYQNGALVFEGASLETADLPDFPADCAGGDVVENVYTYRDMVPIPLSSRGDVHCSLKVAGTDKTIDIRGTVVRLDMLANPKYVKHEEL